MLARSLVDGFPYESFWVSLAPSSSAEGEEEEEERKREVHVVSAREMFRTSSCDGDEGEGEKVHYDCYDPDWADLASRIGDSLLERTFGYGFPQYIVGSTATARVAWINKEGVTDRIEPVAMLTVRTVVRALIRDKPPLLILPEEEEEEGECEEEEEEDEEDEDEDEEEEFLYEVHGVCVDEEERGKGLGTALMQALDRILGAKKGPVKVELHVDDLMPATNALSRWYTERLGFTLKRRLPYSLELVFGKSLLYE